MKYNFKEYEEQDLAYKGPMRRRYDTYVEKYKNYIIYKYVRGEYLRYSVEDDKEKMYVETDDLDEAREFIDTELNNETMELIDFNNAEEIVPEYNGSEKKKTMLLNGKKYLVKFPDPNRSPKLAISYINNVYSEYIGTKIFELCGFETQKVVLGTYSKDGKKRYVCGCEDFTDEEVKLVEFEKFENASVDPNPFKRELKDIYHIASSDTYNIDLNKLKENFWNMFIIDCLIANIDRHNGNWGFLKNVKNETLTFSPIYDCGSCLFSTYTDEDMEDCLNSQTKMSDCINNTSSAIKNNSAKIKYYEFITSLENEDCNKALLRIYDRIDLNKIFALIDNIDIISDIRKEFYKNVIKKKYDKILTVAYKKLNTYKE